MPPKPPAVKKRKVDNPTPGDPLEDEAGPSTDIGAIIPRFPLPLSDLSLIYIQNPPSEPLVVHEAPGLLPNQISLPALRPPMVSPS